MPSFHEAVNALAAAAADPNGLEELHDRLSDLADLLNASREKDQNAALVQLAAAIEHVSLPSAALVALGCGAIVEHAGDPDLAFHAVLGRLPEALAHAKMYRNACRAAQLAEAEHRGGEPARFFFSEYTAPLSEPAKDLSLIWDTLDSLGRGANAMLSRSVTARQRAREVPGLQDAARELAEDHEQAGYLAELLAVLDYEALLVMHPELMLGYWVQIFGVADNFQLHTLLADSLIGDPFDGWIPGVRPDPRVAAAARASAAVPGTTADARFNLVGWRGLQADCTLPTGMDGSDCWIWGEGTPADIEPFQGTRVILLGPSPYSRTWSPERRFDGMHAEIEVMDKLSSDAVRDRLRRIAASENRRHQYAGGQ